MYLNKEEGPVVAKNMCISAAYLYILMCAPLGKYHVQHANDQQKTINV